MKYIFLAILICGSFPALAKGWTPNCNFSLVESYSFFDKPQFYSEPHISYMVDSLEECLRLSGHFTGVNEQTALKVEYLNPNKKSYMVIIEEKK